MQYDVSAHCVWVQAVFEWRGDGGNSSRRAMISGVYMPRAA